MDAPTVIRGHLAAPGTAAEAYLVAWSELLDGTPGPDALRAELARVCAQIAERRQTRQHLGSVPWLDYLSRTLPRDIATATERRQEADACLLRAQADAGYLGKDADTTLQQG